MTSYAGESWQKKIARVLIWQYVFADVLGEPRMLTRRHLILASRECGDASALRALRVPGEQIVAIDRDAIAIDECRRRFPEVDARNVDLVDVLHSDERFASIFLDLTNNLSKTVTRLVSLALLSAESDGVVAVEILRGREPNAVMTLIRSGLEEKARLLGVAVNEVRDLKFERTKVLEDALYKLMVPMGVIPVLLPYEVFYSNGTSPMQVVFFLKETCEPMPWCKRSWSVAWSRRNEVREMFHPGGTSIVSIPTSEVECKRLAAELAFQHAPEKASLVLNMPPGQVAALKAHGTMGTYGKVRK